MNKKIDPAVIEILASRICHDLISPVGAVHNGIEFLEEMGVEAGGEAIALIAHSAQQASSKLQAFRMVYGAGGRDPNIKPADVKKVFAGMIDADGKIKQDWDPSIFSGMDLPGGFCKMLMGCLMLATESLPKGGTVRVTKLDGELAKITIEGTDAAARPQVREALAGTLSVEDIDPRMVHPFVLGILAAQYGFVIEIGEHAQGRAAFHLRLV